MQISLVVASVGRVAELRRLFESLASQTCDDFEVILVDQNSDDRLGAIIDDFSRRFRIVHVRSPKGLSRARNIGMQSVSGSIVAFPDDDCWYEPTTLEFAARYYEQHPDVDGLMGRTLGLNGEIVHGMSDPRPGAIDMRNVWRRCNSNTLTFRRHVLERVGMFDESLGVGAGTPWGACEDADLPIRAISQGCKLMYEPAFIVRHPTFTIHHTRQSYERAAAYGRGLGRVLRKHKYQLWLVGYLLARPLGGAVLALSAGRFSLSRFYINNFRGRLEGWLARTPFQRERSYTKRECI